MVNKEQLEEMRRKMGIGVGGESTPFYKLNKVQMSGDDGVFKHTDLLAERDKNTKPTVKELGKELSGVILKMRWQLSKYDEPNNTFYSSTEYDNKHTDEITVFPNKERGSVEALKAKYGLSTQRVVYFYLPGKEIVRLIVKASALSSEKNPEGELGLFDHIQEFADTDTLPCEYITICKGVFREGTNQDGTKNKRKDHYAMTFKTGRALTESEKEKVYKLIDEVDEKTRTKVAEVNPNKEVDEEFDRAIEGDVSPDDIPF